MTIADSDRTAATWMQMTTSGLLEQLEQTLDREPVGVCGPECFKALGDTLRKVHAKIRTHHAAGHLADARPGVGEIAPELDEQIQRLRDEHQTIFGLIDRLVRGVDSVGEQSLEEQGVFIMRVREVIAIIRRHEAEEDRLLYLAVWRDTGGES